MPAPINTATEPVASILDSKQLVERWQDFVAAVAAKNSGLAALLRSSTPEITQDNRISIGVYYRFHQEQLQQPRFLAILEACCTEIIGAIVPFRFELTNQQMAEAMVAPAAELVVSAVPVQVTPNQENNLATMASEVLL